MEFLWFRFSRLIQQDLDSVKGHWNSHYVIGLHYDIVKGRPNELFYLSELHNTEDFLAPVSAQQCDYITKNYLALTESTDEYQEYFQYAFQAAGLSNPRNWREVCECTIIFIWLMASKLVVLANELFLIAIKNSIQVSNYPSF